MNKKLFIGIDVGGTKISAGLVSSQGKVIAREKIPTPPKAKSHDIIKTILELIQTLLKHNNLSFDHIIGIGIGIPGIVAKNRDTILITPNIDLSNISIASELQKIFKVKVVAGNDVDLGLLGEQWLGAGKGIQNIIGLFPGTGIGGAIIIDGKLYNGSHGAASEIGHMIMSIDGPKCSCGNSGCLEALASRWAIERDIIAAVKKGRKTILTKLCEGDITQIKSKRLKKALKLRDPLVVQTMTNVSHVLGKACISLQHIFNPELIILGGGVIEACGSFILPVVKKMVKNDPFFKKFGCAKVTTSILGDDAVTLGAVALVKGDRHLLP